MFFCLRGHVGSCDKYKTLYFNFRSAISTKLEMLMVPTSRFAWQVKWVITILVFAWLMTNKLDKMMVYGIELPCTKSHDSLITGLYVVLRQKNAISSIPKKTTSLLVKISFHSWIFFHFRIAPVILHRATIR